MVSFWDAPVAVARPGPNCAALLKRSPHWAPVPGRHAATPNCGPPVRRPSRPRRMLPRSPRQLEVSRPGRATIEQEGDRRAALRVAAHHQRPPLAGIATHPWVIASQEEDAARQPFWLDIDPFGDGTRYLVTAKPATVGHSAGTETTGAAIPGYWSNLQPSGSGSNEPSTACSPTFAIRPHNLAKLERCVALLIDTAHPGPPAADQAVCP
jgi:hypothetical protein